MPKGKGNTSEQTVKLPPQIEALATRNLEQAERAGQIGYVPYQGPTIAALNPAERANMANNAQMASAFGLQTADPAAALPAVKTYAGGVQGYDPMALYLQALSRVPAAQRKALDSFTMNPRTGELPEGAGGKGKLTPAQARAKAIADARARAEAAARAATAARYRSWR